VDNTFPEKYILTPWHTLALKAVKKIMPGCITPETAEI
jgi:hypothetical protein